MQRGGSAYIMANKRNGTLYVGVTSDLIKRTWEHRTKFYPDSFTARYGLSMLVYHEEFPYIEEAIAREKQLKGGSRKKKLILIEKMNPQWRDLYDELVSEAEGR
jgi:putative endonuclease